LLTRRNVDYEFIVLHEKNVISISPQTTIKSAAEAFMKHHIGTLPVVNADGTLAGILQIRDLLSLVMPDFVNMMQDIDFVLDFGAARCACRTQRYYQDR